MPQFESHAPGSFCLFELITTDQNAAKTFYTYLFGWTFADNPMSPVDLYTMFMKDGRDVAGAFTQRKEQAALGMPPYWDLYIAVPSAEEAVAQAAELGGRIIKAPFDVYIYGRMAVIADPTGAVFCVWEAKKQAGVMTKNEPGSFCWSDLATPDTEAAAAFYTGLFGWTLMPGDGGYLHIKLGEEFIGGIRPAHQKEPPNWTSYVQVEDCAASTAKAKELGAKVCVEPMAIGAEGSISVLMDPQGAAFALFSR